MSLCIPGGLGIVLNIDKKGHFDYSMLRHDGEVLIISLYQQIFNASTIHMVSELRECLSLMKEKSVDFVAAMMPVASIFEHHYVPYATEESNLDIISGYDYNTYSSLNGQNKTSKLGILNNYRGFESNVYIVLCLLIISLLLLVLFFTLVQREKRWIHRRSTSIRTMIKVFKVYLFNSFSTKTNARRLTMLSIISFFLIITPFLLMFKTNQIIVHPPKLLKTFEEAMSEKADIYFMNTVDNYEEYFYTENGSEVFSYYQSNKKIFKAPNDLESVYATNRILAEITKGQAALILPSQISKIMYQCFCSWSKKGQLFKFMINKYYEGRTFLIGFVFSKKIPHSYSLTNYIHAFQNGLLQILNKQHFYPGFDVFPTSKKHKQNQLVLCFNLNQIEMNESTNIYYGDFRLFSKFFYFCSFLLVLSFFVLLYEWLISPKSSSMKRRRRVRRVIKPYTLR